MKFNHSRVPLHLQSPDISKAASKGSDSWETFRPNQIHEPQYREMEDRPSTHAMANIRRYPDGRLDYEWAMGTVLEALKKAEYGAYLTPLEESFLTVLFPGKFRKTEPRQAEIRTQLSRSEKSFLRELIEAHLKEEMNYSGGQGGGSIPGRTRTLTGIP